MPANTPTPQGRKRPRASVSNKQVAHSSGKGANQFRKPKEAAWSDDSSGISRASRRQASSHAHRAASSQSERRLPSQGSGRSQAPTSHGRSGSHSNASRARHDANRARRDAAASRRTGSRSATRSADRPASTSFGNEQLSANLWSKGKTSSSPSSTANLGKPIKKAPRKKKSAPSFLTNPKVRAVLGVLLVVVMVFAIDTGICWGKICNGVHVGDIDLSGMTVEEAQAKVDSTLNDRMNDSDITICRSEDVLSQVLAGKEVDDLEDDDVSVDEAAAAQQTWKLDATTLQANVNAEELVQQALEVGRGNGGIFNRLGAQLFGYTVPATVNMNDSAVERVGIDIDKTMGDPRVNYGVDIEDGVASVTDGHDGNMISRAWLKQMLNDKLVAPDSDHAFVAEIAYAPLQISEEQALECADNINGALNRGATLAFQDESWKVNAKQLGRWVKTKVEETSDSSVPEEEKTYRITPYFDIDKARSSILKHLTPSFDDDAAHVEIDAEGDKVTVKPNTTGTMPVVGDAVKELEAALFQESGDDGVSIQVEGTDIPQSLSFEDALNYGIVECVETYTTEYTPDDKNRNINIHLAADLLNNSVAKANGGTWSFNETAGECNAEKGFKGAGTIVNGETVDEIGGGICQVATTVFNAVYEAGYPVVQRRNHSLYITSYPSGRDAAVSWPDLDFVWKNNSSSDVLLTTSYTSTTITVKLYGIDPGYRVETETGAWKAGKKYKTITEKDDSLPAGTKYTKQSGWDGSKITVKRFVYDDSDELVLSDTFESVYDPRDKIVLKGTG